jgi:hypothetical protein
MTDHILFGVWKIQRRNLTNLHAIYLNHPTAQSKKSVR